MRRTCRGILAGLVLGVALLGLPGFAQAVPPAPAAMDISAGGVPAVAASDAAQPPPGPDLDSGSAAQRSQQDIAIGVGGVALIGLVLLSRRMRKKPVLFVKWKKK
ncbi:hypothetical protein [Bounagaea algeriensis]